VTHYYIYWDNEDAGSVVTVSAVEDRAPTMRTIAEVKIGGEKHPSRIVAKG